MNSFVSCSYMTTDIINPPFSTIHLFSFCLFNFVRSLCFVISLSHQPITRLTLSLYPPLSSHYISSFLSCAPGVVHTLTSAHKQIFTFWGFEFFFHSFVFNFRIILLNLFFFSFKIYALRFFFLSFVFANVLFSRSIFLFLVQWL